MTNHADSHAKLVQMPLVRFKALKAWMVDDTLIVFDQASASLQVLDDLTAWLLLSLDAGLTHAQIEDELREDAYDLALIDAAYATVERFKSNAASPPTVKQEYDHVINSIPDKLSPMDGEIRLSLLGKVFLLQTNKPELASYLHSLAIVDQTLGQEVVDYYLEIRAEASVYRLECNGIELTTISAYDLILPVLMDHLQIIAYQSFDYRLAVHSAVVSIQGKGVMLPGSSGSGKSTLAVYLMMQGAVCFSDEIAVLSKTSRLMPLPLPLPAAIKSGSWPLMQQYFSDINELPVWRRADGRLSKYLTITPVTETDIAVACIVFPHYDAAEEQARLLPLRPLAALQALVAAGYQVPEALTVETVESILNWVNDVPAYGLHYSCLESARDLIQEVLANDA